MTLVPIGIVVALVTTVVPLEDAAVPGDVVVVALDVIAVEAGIDKSGNG